jgi:hypothetical protein
MNASRIIVCCRRRTQMASDNIDVYLVGSADVPFLQELLPFDHSQFAHTFQFHVLGEMRDERRETRDQSDEQQRRCQWNRVDPLHRRRNVTDGTYENKPQRDVSLRSATCDAVVRFSLCRVTNENKYVSLVDSLPIEYLPKKNVSEPNERSFQHIIILILLSFSSCILHPFYCFSLHCSPLEPTSTKRTETCSSSFLIRLLPFLSLSLSLFSSNDDDEPFPRQH